MLEYLKFFLLINNVFLICGKQDDDSDELSTKVVSIKNFMFWPNATIPFYIEPTQFDQEQSMAIMMALSQFAFKTCLKFRPVLELPMDEAHIMLFVNPDGVKRCKIETSGHSVFKSHRVVMGYDCLKSPYIEMMIMKALGFPFEHNRMSRHLFIDVMLENVEPGAVELFTKDIGLPAEMRVLAYDYNSVMHFGERDYSKNGHRTIIIKNLNVKQNRIGLTNTDIRKIEIVYGDECRKRDRQEKIELCQSYPGVARRKRDTAEVTSKSLRVNPDITPPPASEDETPANIKDVSNHFKDLGVDDEVQKLIDQVFKLSGASLKIARDKHCNNTEKAEVKSIPNTKQDKKEYSNDINGILELVHSYTEGVINNAVSNLTALCEKPESIEAYMRACNWKFDSRCRETYRSTKSGRVMYSTNHRPYIVQSTNLKIGIKYSYDKVAWRSGNDTEELSTTPQIRKKREAPEVKKTSVVKEKLQKEKLQKEKNKGAAGNSTKEAGDKRRYFERRQYQTTKNTNISEAEWAASDVSSEKGLEIENEASEKVKVDSGEVNEPQGDSPQSGKGGDIVKETFNFGQKVKLAAQKASLREGNAAEEEDDSAQDDNEGLAKIKAINVWNIRDTFELMEYKKNKSKIKKKNRAHDVPETVKLTKLNKEFYNERRWPEGVLRYVISSQEDYDLEDMRARLAAVAEILKENTCVKLEEVTEEEAINHEDYLVLDTSPDYVTGRVGGQQHFGCIELFKGGQHKQHTAMMVMAMLGFYFEVARHDRDKYIRVHMRHVRPDKLHHFEKIRDEATLDLPYDYKSATHPAWQFWRKIGKTGISTVATFKDKDPDGSVMRTLGQHDQLLSDSDIIKINSIYGIDCFAEPGERRSDLRVTRNK